MIAKIIKSKPGAAPPRSRYFKIFGLLAYLTQPRKSARLTVHNLIQHSVTQMARVMELTSRLNDRVRDPFLHLVLSWHPQEDPADQDILEAGHLLITKLGLDRHQIVFVIHRDRKNAHLHLAINKVHPLTGKSWSCSHDYVRLERACREIEHRFCWRKDRGRFLWAFEGEEAIPRPNPAWHARRKRRATGRDKISDGMRRVEKSLGYPVFSNDIPDTLRDAVRRAAQEAQDWAMFHARLDALGLIYEPGTRGARLTLQGSTESAYASYFGTFCAREALEARFGAYQRPSTLQPWAPSDATVHDAPGATGSTKAYNWRSILTGTSAWGAGVLTQMFQRTYLRRIYTGLFRAGLHAEDMSMIHANRTNLVIGFKDKTALKITVQTQMAIMGSPPLLKKVIELVAREQAWASVRHENLRTKEVREKILNADQIARTASPHDLEMRRAFFEAHARQAEFRNTKARHKAVLRDKLAATQRFVATLARKRDPLTVFWREVAREIITHDRAEFRRDFSTAQAHLYCDIDYHAPRLSKPADVEPLAQSPAPIGLRPAQAQAPGHDRVAAANTTATLDLRDADAPALPTDPPISQPEEIPPPVDTKPALPFTSSLATKKDLETGDKPASGDTSKTDHPPVTDAKQDALPADTSDSADTPDQPALRKTGRSSEKRDADELSNPFEYDVDADLDIPDLEK